MTSALLRQKTARTRILFFLTCAFLPFPFFAQQPAGSTHQIPLVARNSQGPMIQVPANLLPLKLNSKIVPIETVRKEARPRRMVILLDAGGSMGADSDLHPWRPSVNSASLVTRRPEGRALVALLIFNDKIL
jgi:hypothetical protein